MTSPGICSATLWSISSAADGRFQTPQGDQFERFFQTRRLFLLIKTFVINVRIVVGKGRRQYCPIFQKTAFRQID